METTKYVSRHTGEEIDSLLDKVKEEFEAYQKAQEEKEKDFANHPIH